MKNLIILVVIMFLVLVNVTRADKVVDTGWSGQAVGGMGIYCNSDVAGQTCAVGFVLDGDTQITNISTLIDLDTPFGNNVQVDFDFVLYTDTSSYYSDHIPDESNPVYSTPAYPQNTTGYEWVTAEIGGDSLVLDKDTLYWLAIVPKVGAAFRVKGADLTLIDEYEFATAVYANYYKWSNVTDVPNPVSYSYSFQIEGTAIPDADAGLDLVLSADGACGASVILDGSGSSDEGGNDLSYRWYYDGQLFDEGVEVEASPGLGAHTFTLIVNNGSDDSLPDEVVITVTDDTPPEFVVSTDIDRLWPANHKMVKVTPSFEVTDNCEGVAAIELVEITCNQQSEGDIEITDEGIYLRATRDAHDKDGRIYTITYKATDGAGNEATASTEVEVPHSRGR